MSWNFSIAVPDDLRDALEEASKGRSRNGVIVDALRDYLNPSKASPLSPEQSAKLKELRERQEEILDGREEPATGEHVVLDGE